MSKSRKCCDDCPGDDSCPHSSVCMCGSPMDDHDMGSGHSPVSMHEYYCEECPSDDE